jgi:MOSC domain-containing protein YiiM
MLSPASPLQRLLDAPMRAGIVTWIGLRPARRVMPVAVAEARLDPVAGLEGDHWRGRASRARQVTLIGAEDLDAIARFLGRDVVTPDMLRRNVVVRGINLLALKGRTVQLGGAVLRVSGECHPCSRMEEILGVGGYNAVRGHGGMTAEVLEAGRVAIGDAILRRDGTG